MTLLLHRFVGVRRQHRILIILVLRKASVSGQRGWWRRI